MFISCKCLNVLIEILSDNLLYIDNILEDKLNFFNNFVAEKPCKKIFCNYDENIKIKFEIEPLIQLKYVDGISPGYTEHKWKIFQCINCDCVTHAICDEKKIIVMDDTLEINSDEIQKRKTLESFSPVFNIVIYNNTQQTNLFGNCRNDTIITKMIALKERYEKFVLNEMINTENLIAEYRDIQTNLFKENKLRGEQELNSLMCLINCAPDDYTNNSNSNLSPKITHLDTPPTTPDSAPIENSPPFKQQKTIWPSPATNKAHVVGNLTARIKTHDSKQTNDADCLFDLEGLEFDDPRIVVDQPMDENEDDEEENVVHPIRQYSKQVSVNLAKSLPISMPVLGSRNVELELEYEDKLEDNVDIAASIKALAKSVHGDTVFGDLPRPRFSTQI